MNRPRVAFVVQRYGEAVNGGAETLCRLVAERMSRHWDVEVLTSRACDYVTRFENDYPEGVTIEGGVSVRRFNIDRMRSEPAVFSALDRKVLERRSTAAEESEWLREIGPDCLGLYDFVRDQASSFDHFIFFTYLYATTTQCLPVVRDRAVLCPMAHDEPPIHARPFDTFFQYPRALLCNTPEEESFLRRRTGGEMAPSATIGVGIDLPAAVDSQLFRQRHHLPESYVLYAGRIQQAKGLDSLFKYYLALPEAIRASWPLILVGKPAMEIPASRDIRHVGFVSEEEKQSAMAGATFLIAPSQFESLSLVLLEAWAVKTPVLVNGQCEVLRNQVQRANGGLWYDNAEEFREAFAFLIDPRNAAVRRSLGANGRAYVRGGYEWTVIIDRYRAALRSLKDSELSTD